MLRLTIPAMSLSNLPPLTLDHSELEDIHHVPRAPAYRRIIAYCLFFCFVLLGMIVRFVSYRGNHLLRIPRSRWWGDIAVVLSATMYFAVSVMQLYLLVQDQLRHEHALYRNPDIGTSAREHVMYLKVSGGLATIVRCGALMGVDARSCMRRE
jgi:hypothetical protein